MKIINIITNFFNSIYTEFLFNKKFKKQIIKTIIYFLIACTIFLCGIKFRDHRIYKQHTKISSLTKDTLALQIVIDEQELDLKAYDNLIGDKDYLRYIAFKHSDIVIPKHFDHNDLKLVYRMAIRFDIPQQYIYRLINQESKFKSDALSNKNAKGYMQIIPSTFKSIKKIYQKKYGSIDKYNNNQQNIIIGCYYLKYLYNKYNNWSKTFAAYNAGEGNVQKAGGIPNFKETKNYVKYITAKI